MTQIATNALTSLADVKESMGIASSDTSKDNLIIRKINQASQQISNYCERVFQVADYTEIYNGSLIDELVLNQRPVNSVTSLEYRGTSINTESYISINSQFYYLDATAGILKLLFNAQGHWNRWRVVYNAGYAIIPSDLAEACAQIATYYVNNSDSQVQVRSKQEGQRRIDFYQGITGFRNLLRQLGLDEIIDGYANWPLRSE